MTTFRRCSRRGRLAAAALAVAVLAGGCGGGQRSSVAGYIDRVNAIETGLKGPIAEVVKANRQVSGHADLAKLAPRLARSERTIGTLRARLEALDPPPAATVLHRRLLLLVGAEAGLAHELHQLAVFLPGYQRALRGLTPASARFRTSLGAAKTASAEAQALDRYRRDVGVSLAMLRPLRPPPVLRPGYDAQVATLTRVRASAGSLAAALRAKRYADARTLVQQLGAASVSGGSVPVQHAQIAAVKAYDARVGRVNELAARVRSEFARLETSLR